MQINDFVNINLLTWKYKFALEQCNSYLTKGCSVCSGPHFTNKVAIALHPIRNEYVPDDRQMKKGALAFSSQDHQNNHQQGQQFEESTCHVIQEKLQSENCWTPFSNGCVRQFEFRYCIANMIDATIKFNQQ